MFEETGLICDIQGLLATDYNEKYDTSIAIFNAAYMSGKIIIQTHEIKDAKWFAVKDALEQPLAFDIKKVLLKLT